MSMLGGWLLVPAVLVVACVALGRLVEQAGGREVPGTLVPALGLATMISVAGAATIWDATAEAAVPLVAALCLFSLVSAPPWQDPRLRRAWPWPVVVATGGFAIFALPSLWTGQGSIAGYIKLDDSATWLAIADHVFTHGRDLSGLAPSSVSATLETWLGTGYPIGAFMPLGVASALAGQDVANAYQPVIAVAAAILALGLLGCAREAVRGDARAAACALIGVQASLFLGYAQWGGIKEATTAALLAPLALFAVRGHLVALGVVAGATLCVLSINGLAWAGPALVVAAVLLQHRRRVASAVATCAVAALPAWRAIDFVRQTTQGAISSGQELGNLTRPVSLLQVAGVWPTGDFRVDPDPRWTAVALAVAVLAAAYAGVLRRARAGDWVLPALVGIALAGATAAVVVGAPWVDAKALAIVSPVILLAGATAISASRVALAALGCVLLWSTLLVARDVYVAPRDRMVELHDIAALVAEAPPTLVLDPEVYADRHFLRRGAPEGASDLRERTVALRGGAIAPPLTSVDVDDVATPDLWQYRSLVRRRTPVGSRPPSAFRRVHAGDGFEVWQRDPAARPPLARLALGGPLDPVAVPDCAAVAALARTPGIRVLSGVARRAPVVVDLGRAGIPLPWHTPAGVVPVVDGSAAVAARVPQAGRWRLWVGGSALGRLELRVNGRSLGVHRHDLVNDGEWQRFGVAQLDAGSGVVGLRYARGHRAGRGRPADQAPLGPVAFTRAGDDLPPAPVQLAPRSYRRFCDGRTYDWIEALG